MKDYRKSVKYVCIAGKEEIINQMSKKLWWGQIKKVWWQECGEPTELGWGYSCGEGTQVACRIHAVIEGGW